MHIKSYWCKQRATQVEQLKQVFSDSMMESMHQPAWNQGSVRCVHPTSTSGTRTLVLLFKTATVVFLMDRLPRYIFLFLFCCDSASGGLPRDFSIFICWLFLMSHWNSTIVRVVFIPLELLRHDFKVWLLVIFLSSRADPSLWMIVKCVSVSTTSWCVTNQHALLLLNLSTMWPVR